MRSSDVVLACVAENRPNWYRMVENLVISTRNFGGELASAHFIAYFVDGLDEERGRTLRELGVELCVVDRYDPTHPTTNKLRMFQDFAARDDGRDLIALDCDTVVVNDFTPQLSTEALRAMPAGHSPLTNEEWLAFLADLSLAPSDTTTTMLRTGQDVHAPYLNSGVLLIPAKHCAALATSWTHYIDEFVRQSDAGVDKAWTGYLLDQLALTCALLEQGIPVDLLGPEMNLPTAVKLNARIQERTDLQIGLLHYHKHISSSGLLLRTDSPLVNRLIDRVNAVVAARLQLPGDDGDASRRSLLPTDHADASRGAELLRQVAPTARRLAVRGTRIGRRLVGAVARKLRTQA